MIETCADIQCTSLFTNSQGDREIQFVKSDVNIYEPTLQLSVLHNFLTPSINTKTCDETIMFNEVEDVLLESH